VRKPGQWQTPSGKPRRRINQKRETPMQAKEIGTGHFRSGRIRTVSQLSAKENREGATENRRTERRPKARVLPCFSENRSGPNGICCASGTKTVNRQREPNEESDRGQNTGDTSYARRTKSAGQTNLLRDESNTNRTQKRENSTQA
jgi:hypothetical protein